MKHSATVITAPPLAGGFVFGLACYLIALAIDPGRALIGAGVGIIIGFLFVALFWWSVYERWTVPPAPRAKMQVRATETKPVEIHLIDGERGNVEHIYKVKSITDRQLYNVAVAVCNHRLGLTYRVLRTKGLTDEEIAALQSELIDRRWAYRKTPNSGLTLTDSGWAMMKAVEKSLYDHSPTPRTPPGDYT